jgi:signal transduction histidine kinase
MIDPNASREELLQTVQALQEELIAAQRLALLGSMAAMVTHEFNNLLTPIIARCEAALMMPDDTDFMRKAVEKSLPQAQRAIRVAQHLLDAAHAHSQPTETCDLRAVVDEALATTTRPFDKDGIDLQVRVPEDLTVVARSDLLCQLLLNLILNARAAMQGMSGPLIVAAAEEGDTVRIDVQDSGQGIPEETIRDVFNPFLAADPQARPHDWQQIGLGLSVCRMIARHHGATIEVQGNAGPGVTFRVHWPRGL